jgi:hypothetical protein
MRALILCSHAESRKTVVKLIHATIKSLDPAAMLTRPKQEDLKHIFPYGSEAQPFELEREWEESQLECLHWDFAHRKRTLTLFLPLSSIEALKTFVIEEHPLEFCWGVAPFSTHWAELMGHYQQASKILRIAGFWPVPTLPLNNPTAMDLLGGGLSPALLYDPAPTDSATVSVAATGWQYWSQVLSDILSAVDFQSKKRTLSPRPTTLRPQDPRPFRARICWFDLLQFRPGEKLMLESRSVRALVSVTLQQPKGPAYGDYAEVSIAGLTPEDLATIDSEGFKLKRGASFISCGVVSDGNLKGMEIPGI